MVKESCGISMDCGVVEVVISPTKVALSGSARRDARNAGVSLAKTLVRYPAGCLNHNIKVPFGVQRVDW